MTPIQKILSTAVLAVACVLPTAPAGAADASAHPRAALVIGNADYVALNPVTSAANDEHDMCEALTGLGYDASCFADVKDAREFKARIQDFAAALKPRSEVVFYFAGHALQVKGENYLVPVAAAPRSDAEVPRETVSLAYVLTQLLQGKHYLSVAILDACRGPAWPAASHGMTAGLAPITAIPKGTLVMYATAPADYAGQADDRNGAFTRHLLANITSPGLTADELFRKVSEGVQGDAGDAAASVQSPALYTNFTGEFCFGGCIDKVARAELEKIEKENEEQLDQARQQKAELEARKRAAQAKLVDAAIAANCGASVLGDTGRCFAASPGITLKAIATAFIQRGFMPRRDRPQAGAGLEARITQDALASSSLDDQIADIQRGGIGRPPAGTGEVDSWWVSHASDHADDHPQEINLEGERSSDDPTDRNVSETVKISATLRNVASINRCIVMLAATRRTVLHDEYHTWGTIGFVPIATSKQYQDVVKNDVNVTDPGFYQDLFAATERGLRAQQAASSSAAAGTDGGAANAAGTGDSPFHHERSFDAPTDLAQRTVIEALVARGYIVTSLDPELGTISTLRRTQDPRDKRYAIESVVVASVTTPDSGIGSQLQLSAEDLQVLRRDPAAHAGLRAMTGTYNYQPSLGYETIYLHRGAVTDAGFYRELFATIDASLHGNATLSKHSQHLAGSNQQTLHALGDALTHHGYYLSINEEKLGLLVLYKRTAIPLKTNDGWTSTSVSATVYLRNQTVADPTAYVAASSQDAMFQAQPIMSSSFLFGVSMKPDAARACHVKKKCTLEEVEAKFLARGESGVSLDSVTQEGEADAAAYSDIMTIVGQSTR